MTYVLGGYAILATVLDGVANAIALITPLIAGIVTTCIVLAWFLAYIILPSHPLPWVFGNQQMLVKRPGIQPTAYAVGIVLLLWVPFVIASWQAQPPPSPDKGIGVEKLNALQPTQEEPKTLHDYFLSDFNRLLNSRQSLDITLKKGGETINTVKIEAQLHSDFEAKAEFLSFYIPSTDSAYGICEYIAKELYKKALTNLKSGVAIEAKYLPSERGVNMNELRFTGGVFIYHEYPLFESNKDTLIPLFKTNGLSPQFRGADYVYLRNNPSSSPLRTPSPK